MNSIDNLKATLSKKGGVAFANRFQIFFTPPTATLSALASKDIGSLLGSLVSGGSIKNLIPDPRDISILCESVTLPGRNINTLDYQADKQAIKIPYGIINEDVVMSFILTNDYAMKKMFDDWMESIFIKKISRLILLYNNSIKRMFQYTELYCKMLFQQPWLE